MPDEPCAVPFHADTLHDLAGPVGQVCAMLDLFRRKYHGKLDGEAEVMLSLLSSSGARLRNIVDGLQTYTRIVGAPRACCRCDGNGLLDAALVSVGPLVRESGASVTHEALPEVMCDPNQMIYAFTCLLENSIKFRADRRPEIHVSFTMGESGNAFFVRDNGMGIESKHKEKIFHLFKRIHGDRYPGTGVGLAIVRRIVEQHGGRIWLESEPGRGTTFFFALANEGVPAWLAGSGDGRPAAT